MKKAYFLLLFPFFLSCATQLYVPSESINNIPLADLKHGRELYVRNCASCHQLYAPEKYQPKVWAQNLEEMQPKAKISNAEKDFIYQYLIARVK